MRASREQEFEAFVRRRRDSLLRTATILTAGDPHLAEDVVQTALVRLYLSWSRARRTHLDAYARRTLVNCLVDEKRRPHRREHPVVEASDDVAATGDEPTRGLDGELLAALASLPVGMRTAVVLRHVEDLSVEDTAAAMGCSVGNVKSQTARGLEKLRAHLGAPDHPDHPDHSDSTEGARP